MDEKLVTSGRNPARGDAARCSAPRASSRTLRGHAEARVDEVVVEHARIGAVRVRGHAVARGAAGRQLGYARDDVEIDVVDRPADQQVVGPQSAVVVGQRRGRGKAAVESSSVTAKPRGKIVRRENAGVSFIEDPPCARVVVECPRPLPCGCDVTD